MNRKKAEKRMLFCFRNLISIMRRFLPATILVLLVCSLSACGNKPMEPGNEVLKFAYISKDLNHYWFQQVVSGIESKCLEYSIYCDTFDANFDDGQCMDLVDYVVEQKYDGLMICTTNQQLGPEIGEKCKAAGIPVITIDETMKYADGTSFSHVGMATREVGGIGGVALTKLAKERNFFEQGNKVTVLELTVTGLSVFQERLDGYDEALLTNTPLTRNEFVVIDTPDGMYENNRASLETYFEEHPDSDTTHWIICGINDDCALSCMHYLRDAGVAADHMIACGLGGYELSVSEFEAKNENYISIMLQPDNEGSKATELLYNHITKGEPMTTSLLLGGKLATCDNYLVYFNYSKLTDY